MLPDRITFVDSLPLTRSNKLDERRLLEQAGLTAEGAPPSVDAGSEPPP